MRSRNLTYYIPYHDGPWIITCRILTTLYFSRRAGSFIISRASSINRDIGSRMDCASTVHGTIISQYFPCVLGCNPSDHVHELIPQMSWVIQSLRLFRFGHWMLPCQLSDAGKSGRNIVMAPVLRAGTELDNENSVLAH